MYEPHTAREDTLVFPAFKKEVEPKGYDELGDQFEDIEKREFGGDGFDIEPVPSNVGKLVRRLAFAALSRYSLTV